MIAKTFEIRDIGTFIPVLAIQLAPDTEDDRHLLARAGYYGETPADQDDDVVLVRLEGDDGSLQARYDPRGWSAARTMSVAHQYIAEHFSALTSGCVIDVQYILGETSAPKTSERAG